MKDKPNRAREPDGRELAASMAEWLASAIQSGATPSQILEPFTTAVGAAVSMFAESSARPGKEHTVVNAICGAVLHRANAALQAATPNTSTREH